MPALWDRLNTLRAIVDTVRAEELEREPEAVRTRYEPYAESYFAIEAVKRMEQRLLNELRAGRSITGYLSADFGYGKTATAIYLWKRCLDNGIVAVPPFLFRQLKDIMQATKGWLAYQLQHTQPALIPRLEGLYHAHIEHSVERLAEEIATKYSISEARARAIVQEHIAHRRDITTTQALLDFLYEATVLSQEAGFKGLVIFADEIQEFLRTEEAGAPEAIQMLSEMVKGVRAMANSPLALIVTMPVEPTEAAIEEQAGDIMHRMRERGTALQLQDAYGREFPKELWEYLCRSFGDEEAKQAVEERTLEALGQLCERKDLSNGPRTVINAFKRIAQHYRQHRRPYTPIDLMDDYIQGLIVFEGREAKLTSTLRRLLELPAVRNDPQRQQAVKLMAAFPRGVDQSKAGEYYAIIEELADKEQWLGEHITQLTEGYALVGLQERIEARPILDEIARDFRRRWHYVYSEAQKLQLAILGFLQEILPLLFPPRAPGQYANFGGHKKRAEDFERDAGGVLYEILNGSFERLFSRFPNRKICVAVSSNVNALIHFLIPENDVDLDFRFFLETPDDPEAPNRIESANRDRRVDFHLNLKRTFGRQFPPDLAFLRDIMLPERTSAQVLLGLSMRMWGWLKEHPDMSEADRQMLQAQRRALHRYALQLLLPDAADSRKVQTQGIKVSGAEQRLIESAFEEKCNELYPHYKPLMVTKEWKSHLRRYRDVLSRLSLAERRGREPFVGTKEQVAKAFGWSHTVFESNSRTLQTMGLLEVHLGKGRGATNETKVLFKEHPLETLLREAIQREGQTKTISIAGRTKYAKSIEISRLRSIARKEGYLPEEVDEALELLILRQYLQREADGTVHEFAGAVDAEELSHQAQELEERLAQLDNYFQQELDVHRRLLYEARVHLSSTEDEIALDAAQRKLDELRVRLEEFIRNKSRELANQLAALATELERRSIEFKPHELEKQVIGVVDFDRRVDDQRKALQRQFRQLRQQWERLYETVRQVQQQAQEVANYKMLCHIAAKWNELNARKRHLEKELKGLNPYLTGLQHWREIVAKATALRERLDPESPLCQQLDEEVTIAIMENFATRQLEALMDWERFKTEVDAIEAEVSAEENRQRNEFHNQKEQYEQLLGRLIPQRMVQATFDPKDPQSSYQVLYQGVLRKLRDWFFEQREVARRLQSELEYLICERGIEAENERALMEEILNEIEETSGRLNWELVGDLKEFKRYCEELYGIQAQLKKVQEKLARKRAEKKPLTEEEKPLVDMLSSQPRSLEHLRRQLSANIKSLDELFDRLKSLYRKGYVEIEIRKRE